MEAEMESEARRLAVSIAKGEDPVRRIVTMRYFTFEVEGEDVIFGDELRVQVEELGASELVEQTPGAYPGDRVLRFKDAKSALQELCGES